MRQKFKPNLVKPVDFERFWTKTVKLLNQVEPEISRIPRAESNKSSLICEEISFKSLHGVRIHGYLIRWKDKRKRPLVVHSHGYGSHCVPKWEWAESGLNVFGVDIRGCGLSSKALQKRSHWGYILTGIESPENHVLRGAVCDFIRAVEVGRQIFGPHVNRTIIQGTSFAGGLALMTEAISQSADLLAIAMPTFGWVEGRFFFTKAGSGHEINIYLSKRHEDAEDLMTVLRYFDPVNFADFITCPTLVGLGIQDEIVPAQTVYAIVNHLTCRYEVMEFPVGHTKVPEERLWKNFQSRWMQLALEGIPADFGTKPAMSG